MYPQNQPPAIMTPSSNTCPACGTEMGINPTSGKLGCPHIACCYTKEIPINQAKIITMQHIITDEEVERFLSIHFGYNGSDKQALILALADFLANRPQVAQLRPIAEMPEKVPEGCFRITCDELGNQDGYEQDRCFFADIPLPTPTPDPEAEERRQFEEKTEAAGVCSDFRRDERGLYRIAETCVAWDAWKLRGIFAKKGGDK